MMEKHPETAAESIRDEPSSSLDDLGELYHDYKIFGVTNRQLPGIFSPNQRCKQPIIIAYIQYAIAKARQKMDDKVSFAELFCADGYYTMVARHLGADLSLGIDNDRDGYLGKAAAIAARLRLSNVHFLKEDVNHIDRLERVDIVGNLGGLYHVHNPIEILIKSYRMARKSLILQTVYSMANSRDDYFESPKRWDMRSSIVTSMNWKETFGPKIVGARTICFDSPRVQADR